MALYLYADKIYLALILNYSLSASVLKFGSYTFVFLFRSVKVCEKNIFVREASY